MLDNVEQVIAAAPLVTQLLGACPRLKILATSRTPLHLGGETELPVPPLALPDPAQRSDVARLSQYAAVELFIQRARDVKPDFAVTNDNAPAVAEICHRLDGLPLAIELAAAQDVPARQQTLHNAIAWSHDLLNEREKTLFRRLAVFAGGATLEAVEAVCNSAHDLELDVLVGVGSLVDKNLLQAQQGAEGEPRFAMLQTIHEYALERLEESGEGPTLRRAHAAPVSHAGRAGGAPFDPGGTGSLAGAAGGRARQPARRTRLEQDGCRRDRDRGAVGGRARVVLVPARAPE